MPSGMPRRARNASVTAKSARRQPPGGTRGATTQTESTKEQRPPEQPQQPYEEGSYQSGRGADSERLVELPVRSNVGTEPQGDKPGEGAEAVKDQRAEKL